MQSAYAQSFVAGAGRAGRRPGDATAACSTPTSRFTWRIVDELISDAPSIAVRVGAILAGNYDNRLHQLRWATAGNGVETSLIIGKFWDVAGSLGGGRLPEPHQHPGQPDGRRRGRMSAARDGRHPGGHVLQPGPLRPGREPRYDRRRLPNGQTRSRASTSGAKGFSPSRFPGLEEDGHIVGGRGHSPTSPSTSAVNGFFGQVVAGTQHRQLAHLRRRPELRLRRQLLIRPLAGRGLRARPAGVEHAGRAVSGRRWRNERTTMTLTTHAGATRASSIRARFGPLGTDWLSSRLGAAVVRHAVRRRVLGPITTRRTRSRSTTASGRRCSTPT